MVLFGESNDAIGDTSWIFGDVIFRKFCVMLAQDTQEISFGARKNV